jgi:hypothetical protein
MKINPMVQKSKRGTEQRLMYFPHERKAGFYNPLKNETILTTQQQTPSMFIRILNFHIRYSTLYIAHSFDL